MTYQEQITLDNEVLQLLCDGSAGENRFLSVLNLLVNQAMEIERASALGAGPYERSSERIGYANGFKSKKLDTRLGRLDLKVPQVRPYGDNKIEFYPSALEKGIRSERALKLAIAEMYLKGVSTRKVTAILEQMCGLEVSSTQVSRCAQLLDEELKQWRERPLGEIKHLILDARYEKMRQDGAVRSCAVLSAIGIDSEGRRSVLGVSVSVSEAEVHWREFLEKLQKRGMHGVTLIVSDDHAGLKAALQARFVGVLWQRCQFHLQRNAQSYVPRVAMRRQIAEELRAVFNAGDRMQAEAQLKAMVEKYEKKAPQLAQWLEENVPEGLTVFVLPAAQRRYLRTTNMLERLHREIKRRTRVAQIFPNEESLLRLVSAILAESSDEWETGRRYLPLENK